MHNVFFKNIKENETFEADIAVGIREHNGDATKILAPMATWPNREGEVFFIESRNKRRSY